MELIDIIKICLELFITISFMLVLAAYIVFRIKNPDGVKISSYRRYFGSLFLTDNTQTNLYFRIKYLDSYKLLNGRILFNSTNKYTANTELINSYSDERESAADKKMYKPKSV